jgi:GNAT superfamily N-acetyltransferase
VEFELFDARQATDEEWLEVHAFRVLTATHDFPELPMPSLERLVAYLRDEVGTDTTSLLWLVREHGEIVATGHYHVSHDDADHAQRIAFITIRVHPEQRHRGIGSAFLRFLLPHAVRDDKDTVSGDGVRMGSPADVWTARLGFEPTRRVLSQRLVIAETDHTLWDVPPPAGFRLVFWNDVVPEEWLEPFSRYLVDAWNAGHPTESFSPRGIRDKESVAVHELQRGLGGPLGADLVSAGQGEAGVEQSLDGAAEVVGVHVDAVAGHAIHPSGTSLERAGNEPDPCCYQI